MIKAFILIELFVCGVIIIGLISQVLIPGVMGKPLFPFFKANVKVDEDIIKAENDIETAQKRKKLNDLQKTLAKESPSPKKGRPRKARPVSEV